MLHNIINVSHKRAWIHAIKQSKQTNKITNYFKIIVTSPFAMVLLLILFQFAANTVSSTNLVWECFPYIIIMSKIKLESQCVLTLQFSVIRGILSQDLTETLSAFSQVDA